MHLFCTPYVVPRLFSVTRGSSGEFESALNILASLRRLTILALLSKRGQAAGIVNSSNLRYQLSIQKGWRVGVSQRFSTVILDRFFTVETAWLAFGFTNFVLKKKIKVGTNNMQVAIPRLVYQSDYWAPSN